jgi:asparaginyl-tRNA synthetase
MVNRYPADVKAFYMEPDPKDPRLALCVDVLAPEGYGEIIGGSQRVSSYELLSAASTSTNCRARPSSGISICAATAACRTPASAWASSAPFARLDLRPGPPTCESETIPFARTLHRIYP